MKKEKNLDSHFRQLLGREGVLPVAEPIGDEIRVRPAEIGQIGKTQAADDGAAVIPAMAGDASPTVVG